MYILEEKTRLLRGRHRDRERPGEPRNGEKSQSSGGEESQRGQRAQKQEEMRARGQKGPEKGPKNRRPPIFPPKTKWEGGKIEPGGILYIYYSNII